VYTLIGSLLEERRLAVLFGQEYVEYKKRTPWLVPIKLKQ
jgi:protein-S-isoprenylcysteine O-methyltransferase Ste14